ncbi:MAG: FtsX-like permease family protein [Bdellovibrionota bacterium]
MSLFDRLTYVLALGIALMVAFVVSNTIKLLVYSRKDEVEILSLVGATRNIIRLPFMTEGVLYGLTVQSLR